MLKLIDLTFHTNTEFATPLQLLRAQKGSLDYASRLRQFFEVTVIKHTPFNDSLTIDGVRYNFFKGAGIPLAALRYLKETDPDIILIQGFIFPFQVLLLRLALGRKRVLVLQHHGERPHRGLTLLLHKLISSRIDAYLFTSLGNAQEWIQSKVISGPEKCYEIQAASTSFERQPKMSSRIRCGISGTLNFLWVGRLNANKDPLTVLAAFENYLGICPEAKLYMVYQTGELLTPVLNLIRQSKKLTDAVILKGKIDHEELVYYYSAADFYISGSHRESCGFALIEAMACGCIPIVTNIPTFRKITRGGQLGFLYEPGNVHSLTSVFNVLGSVPIEEESCSVTSHFKKELSFKAIADRVRLLSLHLAGR